MKKIIFGFAILATISANAESFNMTYNTENPFYQPRENEFYVKTQVEMSWSNLDLKGASDINGVLIDSNRDISSEDLFVNGRVGYGVNRQLELYAEGGWVQSDLEWKNLNNSDKLTANSDDLNYINVGVSGILTRTTQFTAKVSADYAFAPDNATAGYGDKVHLNLVVGKEYQNMVLALHAGATFNLEDSETIDYFGLQEEMAIDSSIDYMLAGELMYGFNKCLSANLMIRYEMFNPASEQNINFLNNETLKVLGLEENDNVLTIAGQLNYSITKSILAAFYAGMSFHSIGTYSVVDPFDAQTLLPVDDISDLAGAYRNYNVDDFTTTYVGVKFNIVF